MNGFAVHAAPRPYEALDYHLAMAAHVSGGADAILLGARLEVREYMVGGHVSFMDANGEWTDLPHNVFPVLACPPGRVPMRTLALFVERSGMSKGKTLSDAELDDMMGRAIAKFCEEPPRLAGTGPGAAVDIKHVARYISLHVMKETKGAADPARTMRRAVEMVEKAIEERNKLWRIE